MVANGEAGQVEEVVRRAWSWLQTLLADERQPLVASRVQERDVEVVCQLRERNDVELIDDVPQLVALGDVEALVELAHTRSRSACLG